MRPMRPDQHPAAYHLHFTTAEDFPMSDVYVEVRRQSGEGIATREIGFDAEGRVVHRMPSHQHRFGDYGIFDNAAVRFPVDELASDLSAMEFEDLWSHPNLMPPPIEYRKLRGAVARIGQDLRNAPTRSLTRASGRHRLPGTTGPL